jgi:pilus assembly protein CpaC
VVPAAPVAINSGVIAMLQRKSVTALVLAGLMGATCVAPVSASAPYVLEYDRRDDRSELLLSVGKSQVITSRSTLDQVVIGNPAIADIRMLSNNQVLILGIKPGHTNLVFRDKNRSLVAVVDVAVGYDIGQLKRKLWEVMPDEQNVEVRATNDQVILSGQISSLLAMDKLLAVARSHVPNDKIINMLQIGGGHQVALEVRIAEVARRSLRELGVGLTFSDTAANKIITGTTGVASSSAPFLDVTYVSRRFGLDQIDVQLQALEQSGLARVLAEPNLTAMSGHEASFLAGGEVAIPVSQAGALAGAVTVEYKEFGIGLKFTPTVLNREKINIKMSAEVSSIDTSNAVVTSGFNIPGISTRRAGTTVEVGDGQSFVIAGLLQSDINNVINEVPGLGRLPILGALFRSSGFRRNETELVVVVTPRMVKPVNSDRIALPTDVVLPANWIDQYLLGSVEHWPHRRRGDGEENSRANERASRPRQEGGIAGNFCHLIRTGARHE